eukprot:6179849-Pleurochrysis_carterae.AAC.1
MLETMCPRATSSLKKRSVERSRTRHTKIFVLMNFTTGILSFPSVRTNTVSDLGHNGAIFRKVKASTFHMNVMQVTHCYEGLTPPQGYAQ